MTLLIILGIPASGKTTLAKFLESNHNYIRHSFDEMPGADDPEQTNEVFTLYCQNIMKDLSEGKDVVVDAIMTDKARRKKLFSNLNLEKFDCCKQALIMTTPFEKCIERNAAREKKVDSLIMTILYQTFEYPDFNEEDWDDIILIRESD